MKIERKIKEGDTFYSFKTTILLKNLKLFCKSINISIDDHADNEKFYVPGVMIIAMFRYIIPKISDFPIKKLTSFYGYNGGTKENRLYSGEQIAYKFKYASKIDGKYQYVVEVCRADDDYIILQGIFTFI